MNGAWNCFFSSSLPFCPKTQTERQCRILEAFSKLAETSRRGTGSAIGDLEQTSPADHPFRPAGAPELLCGVAVVITEQTAQSHTTSHLPVRTADASFRFEQRVPEPLMVALSVIMMDELSDGTTQRSLTEEDHPLQALALDRQNKPFDISVQIRRTVRQPNDVSSGVLKQVPKLRGELLVAVQDEESLAVQKAVEWVGEIPTDLHHERAIWPGSYSGNVYFSRRQLDDDEAHSRSRACELWRPRRVKKSVAATVSQWAARNVRHGVRSLRSGAGSMPCSRRILAMVLLATVWPRFERAPRMRVYLCLLFIHPRAPNLINLRSASTMPA